MSQGGSFGYWLPLTSTIGLTALAAFFAAVLVLVLAAPSGSAVTRLLSRRSLRALGRYSYAIYLIHPPVIVLCWNGLKRFAPAVLPPSAGAIWMQLLLYAFSAASCVLLGAASWHLYEKHFLELKRRFRSGASVGLSDLTPGPAMARSR